MPAHQTEWTAEMARALPDDGKRYEVLDGVLLVSPAPSLRHQRAVKLLSGILDDYTRAHRIGETMFSPADIELSPTRLVQPDVFVVPAELRAASWQDVTRLLLAAEVSSPSSARADRVEKRKAYQDREVPEYWVIDLDTRSFDRWRPADMRAEVVTDRIEWHPVAWAPPLSIDLVDYFANIWR